MTGLYVMSNHTDDTSFEYEGFRNPNGTIVPDDVFDVLMPRLADAELRILLYIIRRTFGFKKSSDDISLRQMVEGITTRDGRVLDSGTGLSKPTVARGLAGLREKRIIVATRNRSIERGNEATSYRLRFKGEPEAATDVAGDPRENPGRAPLSHQRDKGLSHEKDKGLSHQRDTQQTDKQQTEISLSNIRKSARSKDDFVDNSPSQWIGPGKDRSRPQHSVATPHDVERIGSIVARATPKVENLDPIKRQPGKLRKLPKVTPEIYEAVVGVMQDYTRKLGDSEHLTSNITQAVNLIVASGCDFNTFYMHIIDAYKITSQRNGLENRSRYFFTVLRDSLLPSDTLGSQRT